MRKLSAVVVAGAAAVVLVTSGLGAAASPSATAASGRYIVVLDESLNSAQVSSQHEAQLGVNVVLVYSHALRGYAATMTAQVASTLAATPGVAWVEADRSVSANVQTMPTGIDRVDAELSPTANIDGVDDRVDVDVAVLDTGVDSDHPDLNVNTAGGTNCIVPGAPPEDDNGHGTHVSGTVGALDNNEGVVGVAPGARIWPVKVLSATGVGLNSQVICGIDFVAAHASEVEVANMSLSGGGSDDRRCGTRNNDAMHMAICNAVGAGVTFAVAAGNEHRDARNSVPAAYDEVITVSALADFNGQPGGGAPATCRADVDDTFADFSNFGRDVDLIAPGVCILSTFPGGLYMTFSGTSMASPHVAGGAALYTANNPAATPAQVKSALQSAGNLNWIWPSQDGDRIQEKLLNVATF